MKFKSEKSDAGITEEAYANAAEDLECDIAAIKAVAEIEARGAGFLPDGRPKILFERHKFRKFTRGRYDSEHPDISGPAGNYQGGTAEYDRLARAMDLDPDVALMSASWGKFQIMGFNHEACGFDMVQDFVDAMVESEDRHLEAFIGFVTANDLDPHLRNHNWARFARGYNGPQYRRFRYAEKLASAYEKYASESRPVPGGPEKGGSPDLRVIMVSDLQRALDYLGISPGVVDNKMGPKTRAAIRRFQRFVHLPETGELNAEVKAAVQTAYHMMKSFDALEADEI